ncbi:O-antigen ligase domain-containing protein [Pseudomonas sp. DY-1]|uniref:O-antigen ligase family protein n=1 Tax=Pseudomonas sp. DY-1 TaxID=1755504 RepID=UPI000EA83C8F|nr:O-antigen ligase family protein [Pseudomonas sp. DY-1]AYF87486.1 O-antigen ligase domain-containing protein [Pseudomonas sp. DY-1]
MLETVAQDQKAKILSRESLFVFFPYILVLGNIQIWFGTSSLTVPFALIAVLPLMMLSFLRGGDSRSILFLLIYGFLFFLGLLSSAYNPQSSWGRHLASLIPVFTGGAVLLCFKDVAYNRKLEASIRNAGLLLGFLVWCKFFYGALYVYMTDGGFYELKSHLSLPLGNSNFLAVYLLFFLAFTVGKGQVWSSLFILLAVFMTMSRFGTMFSIFTILLACAAGRFTVSAVLWPLALVCFSVFLLIMLNIGEALALLREGYFPSLLARAELWEQGKNLVQVSPVLGAGPGGFTTHLDSIAWPRQEWGSHNWILSVWVEYGVTGFLLYLFMISMFFLQAPVKERVLGKRIKLGIAITLLFGLFENVVGISSYEALFAFSICVLLSLQRLDLKPGVVNRDSL